MKRPGFAVLLFIVVTALLYPARASADAASPWYETEQGRARLIAATADPGSAASIGLGLQFELAPHWKIYWRSPGDAGFPPELDWKGSTNLADATIAWPAPERFSVQGLETAGYSGAVVLPITVRVAQPGQPLHLKAHLSYLTCSAICVPRETDLALDLPGAGAGYAALIDQYRAQVPGDGTAEGLALTGAALRPGAKAALDLTIASQNPLAAPDAFVEGVDDAVFGAPAVLRRAPTATTLRLPISGNWRDVVGRKLTVTLVDGSRSMTAPVTVTEGEGLIDLTTFATMLGLALIGGLILNLMPCVLPVLSLKLLAALPRTGETLRETRRGFLGTAMGIVLSFLVLAVATAAAKTAGLAVGWGVQFQDPLFLIALDVLLVLFACNLWGFFEVPLPRAVAAIAERGPIGSVATGAFATVLATPCSAPFVGTALGFALRGGPPGDRRDLPRARPRHGRALSARRSGAGAGAAVAAAGTVDDLSALCARRVAARHRAVAALRLERRAWPARGARHCAAAWALPVLALAVLHEPVSRWMLVGAALIGALFVRALRRRCHVPLSIGRRAVAALSIPLRSAGTCAMAMSSWSMSPPIGASPARSMSGWCSIARRCATI